MLPDEIKRWKQLRQYVEPLMRLLEEKSDDEKQKLIERIYEMEFSKIKK